MVTPTSGWIRATSGDKVMVIGETRLVGHAAYNYLRRLELYRDRTTVSRDERRGEAFYMRTHDYPVGRRVWYDLVACILRAALDGENQNRISNASDLSWKQVYDLLPRILELDLLVGPTGSDEFYYTTPRGRLYLEGYDALLKVFEGLPVSIRDEGEGPYYMATEKGLMRSDDGVNWKLWGEPPEAIEDGVEVEV